jgi:carbonic anhydrase
MMTDVSGRGAIGALVACALGGLGFFATATPTLAQSGIQWGYEGPTGPSGWGNLGHGSEICAEGMAQSPIDLTKAIPAEVSLARISWQGGAAKVENNGHTIQVDIQDGGSTLALNDQIYTLIQFHFHHPSEHLLDGQAQAMEAHFVHKSDHGDLAVVGVMIRPGRENAALAAIWDVMPATEGSKAGSVTVDPSTMLPSDPEQFRYSGSLTTPPCSEIVHWVSFKTPIEASEAQIKAFAKLFPMNARPVQPIHRRFLLIGD